MTTQYFLPGKALVHCNQVTSHFSCWQAKQMEVSISAWKAVFPCHFCGSLPSLIFHQPFQNEHYLAHQSYIQSVKIILLFLLTLFPSCLQWGVTDILNFFCLFAAGMHRELSLGCPWRQWAPSEKPGCGLALCSNPGLLQIQCQVPLTLCSRPTLYPADPISPMSCWVQLQLSGTSL